MDLKCDVRNGWLGKEADQREDFTPLRTIRVGKFRRLETAASAGHNPCCIRLQHGQLAMNRC